MSDSSGHVWRTRSRHPSREGVVAYQRCHCGLWRVLVELDPVAIPARPRG